MDIENGWLTGIDRVPSPNCDDRPDPEDISLIVIHGISLPPGEFGGLWIDALFTNSLPPDGHPYFATLAGLRVSAHVLVRRDGEAVQYVPFHRRAWHAGASHWRGRERCNDFSIGIELEGGDDVPFEDAQYGRLVALIQVLRKRYPIAAVVGHSDIAPGRKTDPGPCFEWQRLLDLGVDLLPAVWRRA